MGMMARAHTRKYRTASRISAGSAVGITRCRMGWVKHRETTVNSADIATVMKMVCSTTREAPA